MLKVNRNQHHKVKNSKDQSIFDQYFNCSTGNLIKYTCLKCNYRTHLQVRFVKHKCINWSPGNYFCEECRKFKTHSVLLFLRHKNSRCKVTKSLNTLTKSEEIESRKRCNNDLIKCTSPSGEVLPKYKNSSQREKVDNATLVASPLTASKCTEEDSIQKNNYIKPDKEFKCDKCTFVGKCQSSLELHKNGMHAPPNKITWLKCSECSYQTKWPSDLKGHTKRKHGSLENMVWFQCDSCDYKTYQKNSFKRHKLVHVSVDKIQWLQCDQCPYKAKCKRYLSKHKLHKHTDSSLIKWAKCELCPYKTKQSGHLKLHVLVKHTTNKNIEWFECEYCPFKAKVKSKLKSHIWNKHTDNEKINWFKCGQCEYETKFKQSLKRHYRARHHVG